MNPLEPGTRYLPDGWNTSCHSLQLQRSTFVVFLKEFCCYFVYRYAIMKTKKPAIWIIKQNHKRVFYAIMNFMITMDKKLQRMKNTSAALKTVCFVWPRNQSVFNLSKLIFMSSTKRINLSSPDLPKYPENYQLRIGRAYLLLRN